MWCAMDGQPIRQQVFAKSFVRTNSVVDVQHAFQREFRHRGKGQVPSRITSLVLTHKWHEKRLCTRQDEDWEKKKK
jgi:hypothetical protein